ncbi:MAG: bifunctional 4-hydroxy-2-oxoglutarate aldolase/2-dehydro-3-deoxy-phosphogluconate aldolase, partial [Candidatus Hydrogenedentes bacterium]|nr:bifunctional 4-hydroxy-2-oxoglutarate aldolase/2-dehydro-3-deoxy-phosphogluconate aldolase [Candidatus Hydrogenedentota bacterium]
IVRVDSGGEDLVRVVEAVAAGGVHCIEVTMTTPGALDCIALATEKLKGADVLLGVGSVLDGETARLAILAGAEYIVSPVTREDVIKTAQRYGKVCMPGALTPTEILNAWELGGDFIKIFPATLGGIDYIKAVAAPMPQIPMIPTGGVDTENIKDFISAGVAAVGIGSNLVSKKLVAARDFEGLKKNAQAFAEAWRRGKE